METTLVSSGEPQPNPLRRAFRTAAALLTTLLWLAIFIATFLGFLVFPLAVIVLVIAGYVAIQAIRLARRG